MISQAQAEKVFEDQLRGAVYATHRDALAKVETGALLEESVTQLRLQLTASALSIRNGAYRMEYLIPAERDQPAYPRSFVVLFRMTEKPEQDRAAGLYYFVQAEAGGPWKAAAKTWAADKPASPPGRGQFEDRRYGGFGFDVRDKPIAAPARGEGGSATLSPTAAADRGACARYADYLTFTAPNGIPESEHFAAGKLTSGVVGAYNDEDGRDIWNGLIRHRYAFEVTGAELPVLRLADGKSLVTCSFVRTDRREGKSGSDAWFTNGSLSTSDRQVVTLLGDNKNWLRTVVRRSVTATFEVPAQGPADVVGCNCLGPELLSAEGTPK
ncbi:hypothetical protein [Streptomyces sp. NPDC058674]|uniref:hypothetical protein n=1 Tax=Streptomyces sp. NPDC058674 TaxID=3346592 RepID=UPI0036662E07